ncbi:MAG: OmpA family protein [Prevotella sp.]|nr:OmpA family protein [Prevotella sp.]
MKNKRLFTLATAALMMAVTAQAQTSDWKSYTYVEAQGGLQLTATQMNFGKLITPTAAFSLGHYFTPVVGARLHVNGWQAKSGVKNPDQYYKWNYITPDLDLMINLSNLFSKNYDRFLNVILLGGVGLNYAWDNDELKALNLPAYKAPLAWDKNRLSHNLRAGLRLETNMQKPLGLSLEVNANSLDDRFNSKTNDADDWMFTAMLGVNFRFGHKAAKKDFTPKVALKMEEPAPATATAIMEEIPVVKKVMERRPVVSKEKVNLHKEVFYDVRLSDNDGHATTLKEVAQFMKDNPNSKIQVVGYADKVTGNAKLNVMYAKRRAEQFKADLVEKYGCNAANILIDSKGDTVQPFPNDIDPGNNRNRCVIVDGEGTREVTTYKDVEVEKTVMEKVERKATE